MILRKTFALFCAMLITPAVAEMGNFVYDDHGKKDPFSPLVSPTGVLLDSAADMNIADLNLEGIVSDPGGHNVAIVNGKIVGASDRIGPYEVRSVAPGEVRLGREGQEFVLQLKKGDHQ